MIRKYLLPILAVLGALFAGWTVMVGARPSPAARPVAAPAASPFERRISGAGIVEASSRNISLGSHLAGVAAAVHVQPGDRVEAGAPVFSLDDRPYRAELAVRQAEQAQAAARLERLKRLPRPEEIPPAQAAVKEAESGLEDARAQLANVRAVGDRRAVSQDELNRRAYAADAAEARLAKARADLALLKAGAWAPDLEAARAELAQAEARVQAARTDLERLTVRSPVAGQILQANLRPGEYVPAGPAAEPLVLVGVVDRLRVRVDIDENDAWRFDPAAPAAAFVRGNPGLKTALRFEYVEPYVLPKRSLTGGSQERVDTRVLQVLYSFEREELPVYAGQQVDVYIEDKPDNRRAATVAPGENRS